MAASPIEMELARHARRIGPILQELVPRHEPPFLGEPAWYHLETGGKRLRSALCLLTAEALGGDSEKALHFAAAVELLHNMLLVHDDIEDGDTVRRNKPTVWKQFGVANAINLGDYLLARALRAVMRSPVPVEARARLTDLFLSTYERTIAGQALDVNSRCDPRFTVEDYLRMVTLKTGHYLVVGMVGGAMIAGAPEATLDCLRRLGESLGPAFQIRDDVLDLTVGKGRGGVTGSDIREGKASILYAHALAHSSRAERERLLAVMRKPREETTDADVSAVLDLYGRRGSVAFAQETADRLIQEAQRALDALPAGQQPLFRDLVATIAERKT
jgi:geranylgeranyl pyrophosphate synthase